MAFSASCIWECRTAGSDNAGGGFDPTSGIPGTDRSQQDAVQTSFTDLVIDGTTNTKCTSAAFPFSAADVGNIINITAGTGWTVQRVQIMSVSGVTATCDKSLGTLSSTGGTGNLGGALASPGMAAGLQVAGNNVWVKAGTYTFSSTTANVATGRLNLATNSPDATTAMFWEGYQTTRGDRGTKPIFLAGGGFTAQTMVTISGLQNHFVNFEIDGAGNATVQGISQSSGLNRINSCYVHRSNNAGISTSGPLYDVEISACGGSQYPLILSGAVLNENLYIHDNTSSAAAAIALNAAAIIVRLICSGNAAAGLNANSSQVNLSSCDFYNNTGDGVIVTAASNASRLSHIDNCVFYGNGGWGVNVAGVSQNLEITNCAFGSNTSGSYSTSNTLSRNVRNPVTLSANPFTNAAGGDFSLNNTAGGGAACRAAGVPGAFPGLSSTTGYLSIGAVQEQASTTLIVVED